MPGLAATFVGQECLERMPGCLADAPRGTATPRPAAQGRPGEPVHQRAHPARLQRRVQCDGAQPRAHDRAVLRARLHARTAVLDPRARVRPGGARPARGLPCGRAHATRAAPHAGAIWLRVIVGACLAAPAHKLRSRARMPALLRHTRIVLKVAITARAYHWVSQCCQQYTAPQQHCLAAPGSQGPLPERRVGRCVCAREQACQASAISDLARGGRRCWAPARAWCSRASACCPSARPTRGSASSSAMWGRRWPASSGSLAPGVLQPAGAAWAGLGGVPGP